MIVQMTMARNERPLLEAMLPVWKTYADGFVFLIDTTDDGTLEFLESVREEYNILEIITHSEVENQLKVETDLRQSLFDTTRKYSSKIICLDADEYLDGAMSKEELNQLLADNPDTVFHLQWIQYTSINSIRVDGPWRNNIKDRMGSYQGECRFIQAQNHSTHLPIPEKQQLIASNKLFVAHLQWLDKNFVAIKQYYWKVFDYVNNKVHGVDVAGTSAYDESVADFNWEEEYFPYTLRVQSDLFEDFSNHTNYRVKYIVEQTKLHNIPNLGDWGYNFRDSIPMYFCTAADEKHYPLLLNMIGSIHYHNYYDVVEIRVYDIGLNENQIAELTNFKKVKVCKVEETNPDILKYIETGENRQVRGLFSWKPVLIKDSLDYCDYVLYLDAGTTILRPLNQLFQHIKQNGYLLFDCGHSIKWMTTNYLIDKLSLNSDDNQWILSNDTFGIDAGFMGVSRKVYQSFVLPMYEYSKDLINFIDDGTCPDGWGTGRHDQTLFSIQARKLGLHITFHGRGDDECYLLLDGKKQPFQLTHTPNQVNDQTTVFRSRWNIIYEQFKVHTAAIRRKYKVSVITGIGSLTKYERFIDNYINNITQMVDFASTEYIIVYVEWSAKLNQLKDYPNVVFVKDEQQLGVYNAWNLGIQNASCEYITNWNIDDIRYSINNILKSDLLKRDLQTDLVYSYYIAVLEDELGEVDLETKLPISYPDNFHEQVLSMCMAGPDPMWRKSAHMFVGVFNKSYSIIGDWEMWVRMAKYGLRFRLIPHVLGVYVDHSDTVSQSNTQELERQKQQLIKQYQIL